MTLTETIASIFSKRASSPAQRAVSAGAPDAAENPSEAQKRVGNYQKVHLSIDGFRISIENPKGSYRSGTAPDGTKWRNMLACDYGDIRGTESVDGDPVDIYLSDHPEKGAVFVIDQIDPRTKKFDEHKVMYGFDSVEDAKKTYLACYQNGWGGLGWITPVSKAEFRKWIDSSTRKTKPFHEYASVTPIVDPIKVKAAEAATGEDDAEHPIPEEMKKKFPKGKWVVEPCARGPKIGKIVGWYYGGKRDNGRDYWCCWLDHTGHDGDKNRTLGLAMYGGHGDWPLPLADSEEDAERLLVKLEEEQREKVKKYFAKEQEKTAQANDGTINVKAAEWWDNDSTRMSNEQAEKINPHIKAWDNLVGNIDLQNADGNRGLKDPSVDGHIEPYSENVKHFFNVVAPYIKQNGGGIPRSQHKNWKFWQKNRVYDDKNWGEGFLKKYPATVANENGFIFDIGQLGRFSLIHNNSTGVSKENVYLSRGAPDSIAVHEVEHARASGGILDGKKFDSPEDLALYYDKLTGDAPGNVLNAMPGMSTSDKDKLKQVYGHVIIPAERAAVHAQHLFRIQQMFAEKNGRNPTGKEFVEFVNSLPDSKLWELLRTPLSNYEVDHLNLHANPLTMGEYDKYETPWAYWGKDKKDWDSSILNDRFHINQYKGDRRVRDQYIKAYRDALLTVAQNNYGKSDMSKIASALEKLEKSSQASDNPMEGVPAGVKLRSFIDAPATRTAIMDNVLEAVKNRFPIEDDDVKLELKDIKYEGPTSYTLQQQKDALLGNRRLGCRIAGTWRLTDKHTGQVLDERRDGVLRVPYYTDRGTIINNGSEYTVISQARLSPGVYVRRKQNGELESQFNVENGLGFRIGLNKETGALNMSVGQGHVQLYPVLRALGVSDEDIRKSWGNEVTSVNVGQFDPRAVDKLYSRYAGRKANASIPLQEKIAFVKSSMEGSRLDPDVVVRTLGIENADGVTGAVMLRAAQKLLNINRGAEDPDERDNPRFSRFYGVEDMMRERIDKDSGRLTKSMLFRVKRDRNLGRIGRNALSPYLDTFLSGSGLAMPGEEANPLSILTQQSRITRLGEGGISSPDLVTPEARNVQGDYLGYVDFISGPESFGIGIDVRAALGTMKGSDNRLYNKMMDLRTGKTRYVALNDAASHTVAFPGQDPKAPQLYAMRKGVPTMVPREEVDYMVPGFQNTVSAGINMSPMPTAVQAGRQFYSSKFWEQYLPQKEGEVPLVDSLMDDGTTTFSEYYGRKVGCLTAPFAGTVIKANDSEIVVRGKDGQTHTASIVQGLPFNRMTSLTYIPQVKKGDEVKEGAILANSNFTDPKTGAMTMGRNLKVAVLPAPQGASSYEDAIVISEDAAKKLATSRTYNFEQDTKEGVKIARNRYLAAFPKAYTKEQADTIDENGVVKVGTVLHRDDPMILAIGPKMLSAEDAQLGKLSSVLRNALTDKSQKWEHDWPGVVTDVVAGQNGVKVLVKSEPPVKEGDKLCPEMSLKGVVGKVLPTDKMPRDATTNEPYDMLMNPMGFLSRVAPGQILLMNLAKVAKKTGRQIRIPQIPPAEGWLAWTEKQLAENGVNSTADVFDPQTGRTIKGVGDGYAYVKAFHHLAEKKFSARGVDSAYTQDEQPAKGGEDGAKRISGFDNLALLSHGATDVIKDSMNLRGQMNSDYWRRYRLGLPVEEPGVPFIYKKFINTLKAGGVNVVEKGDVTSIMPQTDEDIDELAQGRVLESSQMVDSDFNPVKGGLFDLGKTGGMGGNRWSMIVLPEAVPNPMMEEPVRRVLGLTAKKMEAVLSGREELNGKTGGEAIKDALSKIDIDEAIQKARTEIQTRRGSQRDNAVKVLGYLKAAKEMGMKPENWMITRVPVLPPMFRPVAKMGDVALVPDMNELYKDLIEMKGNYEALAKELPPSALADERLAVYGAVKAAYGLGDPITAEGQAKNLKGAIRQVIGTVPKFGMYQSKVISKTQDLVGRSVITPNRNLGMDQIGIPEDMAWEIFKPFVERKLVQRGYSPLTVRNMIDERNSTARHILDDVMEERPVLMDRAPTWHKFNIMAFKPHITEGRSIQVSPLCTGGFNADFDGDTVNIHVPASDKAVKQALEKMLPSKNLFSLTDMKSMRYRPEKEQISGLWALTRGRTRRPTRYFGSKAEAIAAYRNGEIGPNDPIEIREE